ncbi:MAG: right-handed parallel beta-helix repeat-containing protein [Hymenobacter sp.]|nr:right-handed parallel beta-helix repeat-containing protein [Hymenobacter sp.]
MKNAFSLLGSLAKGGTFVALLAAASCATKDNEAVVPAVPEALSQAADAVLATGEVTKAGTTWTARVNGTTRYTGPDMIAAIQAAVNNLTAGRTTKETVSIRNSGDTGPDAGTIKAVNIPSYTILNFNGTTMNVTDTGDKLIVPVQAERRTDIEIRNLRVTGNPRYGIWLKSCTNIVLSQITMSFSNGGFLGIRVDDSKGTPSKNLSIDNANVSGCLDNAVETYGVDGFTIGTITTSNTGACGLLLNKSKNGTVGTVNATRANYGGGYAAFRVANSCGPNITVGKVIARECGRGFFSVSGSNGVTVNSVDIIGSSSHGILIEDSQNINVKAGTISNCGAEGVRITSRTSTEFLPSQQVTVQSLRVSGCTYGVRETTPRTNRNRILNNNLTGNGTSLFYQGAGTVATGNTQ